MASGPARAGLSAGGSGSLPRGWALLFYCHVPTPHARSGPLREHTCSSRPFISLLPNWGFFKSQTGSHEWKRDFCSALGMTQSGRQNLGAQCRRLQDIPRVMETRAGILRDITLFGDAAPCPLDPGSQPRWGGPCCCGQTLSDGREGDTSPPEKLWGADAP